MCRQCNEGCINKCVVVKYVTRYIILMFMLKTMFGFIVPILNKTGQHTNTCPSVPLKWQNKVTPCICQVSENLEVSSFEYSVQFFR